MEFVVGTALGAAGLAVGLAALFSTCLQVWDFVDAGKAHAKNFSLLRTKLDNQRMLFMIWGTALGFGSPSGYDARLNNPMINPTIEANLHHILRIFSETETLSKRYGIEVLKKEAPALVRSTAPGIFQSRHTNFLNKLRRQQKEASIWKVTRWAIRDEQKFDILVKDLREIIEDLERITTNFISLTDVEELAQDAVGDINDLQSLEEIQEAAGTAPTIISSAASVRHRAIEARTISTMISTMSINDSFHTAPTINLDHHELEAGLAQGEPPLANEFRGPTTANHIGSSRPRIQTSEENVRSNSTGAVQSRQPRMTMTEITSANEKAIRENLEGIDESALPGYMFPSAPAPNGITKRIFKEVRGLLKDGPAYDGAITYAPVNKNFKELIATIAGPAETPYAGGIFHLRVSLPDDYPMSPPRVWFWTKVYHPNIESTGAICLDILQEMWSPVQQVVTLLISIVSLLADPVPDDPIRAEIGAQMIHDKRLFEKTAKEWTKLYATGELLFPGTRSDGFCNTTSLAGEPSPPSN